MKQLLDKTPIHKRSGGSIPIVALLRKRFKYLVHTNGIKFG